MEEFCHAISGRISNYLNFLMNYILLNRNGSTRDRNFILSWLEWQAGMVDPSCKIIKALKMSFIKLDGGRS